MSTQKRPLHSHFNTCKPTVTTESSGTNAEKKSRTSTKHRQHRVGYFLFSPSQKAAQLIFGFQHIVFIINQAIRQTVLCARQSSTRPTAGCRLHLMPEGRDHQDPVCCSDRTWIFLGRWCCITGLWLCLHRKLGAPDMMRWIYEQRIRVK